MICSNILKDSEMRKNDYEDVREQIVEAARVVFAKYGYRKTTIEDISSAVYKAKSSIYHYFSGKDDIFRAVIEKEALQLMQSLHVAVDAESTPVMKFKIFFRFLSVKIEETVNYYRFFKDEWYDILDFANEMRSKHSELIEDLLTSIITDGNNQGIFEVVEPKKKAKAIMVAMTGFLTPWSSFQWEEVSDSIDPFIEIMLFGIMKRTDTVQS